jgi:hypothetical protein
MKKVLISTGIAGVLAAAATYYAYSSGDSRPEFVVAAEAEVNNFLQYTYGPGKCAAALDAKAGWSMACSYEDGKRVVQYNVYPADKAPQETGKSFYLEAQNELAVESASQSMGRFLGIGTSEFNGAS